MVLLFEWCFAPRNGVLQLAVAKGDRIGSKVVARCGMGLAGDEVRSPSVVCYGVPFEGDSAVAFYFWPAAANRPRVAARRTCFGWSGLARVM